MEDSRSTNMRREVLVKWLETLGARLRLARRITVAIGLLLLLYFFGTWLGCYVFYVKERVVLRENPLAALRQPSLTHPAESRAWDLIEPLTRDRERWALADDSPLHDALQYGPSTTGWDDVAAWLTERGDVISQLREASKRPVLGYDFPSNDPNPPAVFLDRAYLGPTRQATRLLRGDAHLAAHEGDWVRFAANIEAMCRLAKLVADTDGQIDVLVGHAMYMSAASVVGTYLAQVPTDRLATLRGSLAITVRDNPMYAVGQLDADTRDILQRTFSDTGDGNGGICRDGIAFLNSIDTSGQMRRNAWAAPRLRLSVNRSDAARVNAKVVRAMETWAEKPPWERTAPAVTVENEKAAHIAFGFANSVWPSTTTAIMAMERTQDVRFAALVAIDMEISKRETGRYPDCLITPTEMGIRRDRFTGDQILYRTESDRVVLYARGPDRDDDGGKGHRYFKWNSDTGFDSSEDGDELLWPPPP